MTTTFTRNVLFLFASLLFLTILTFGALQASAAITTSLDVGARGAQVTELQTYLAAHADLYPEGLVTGYYGALTQAAVQRFQAAQGIVSSGTAATTGYGRVGPRTMQRLNELMGSGGGNVSWDTVPTISPVAVQQVSSSSATLTWTTNEGTQGQVYFDTSTIRADEATGPGQQPFVSGSLMSEAMGLRTGHSVTLTNLSPNTTYYYLIRVTDNAGNTSITWPSGSFRTAN